MPQRINHLYIYSEEIESDADSSVISGKSLLVNLLDDYDKLMRQIYVLNPKLKTILTQNHRQNLDSLQQKLYADELMVEYAITNQDIFIFTLTQNSTNFYRLGLPFDFQDKIKSFTSSTKKINRQKFFTTGKYIYKELIQLFQKELEGKKYLIIKPCSELSLLPFECLPDKNNDYLINKINISYKNRDETRKSSVNKINTDLKYDFIGFAPAYSPNSADFPVLKNQQEVKSIADIFNKAGLKYSLVLGEKLDKESLTNHFADNKIIHIAAHSFVNPQNDFVSSIVLGTGDSEKPLTEIHNFELASGNVKSELVVLSSCESGSGKESRGEGIISLARSFLTAGAGNLIVAMWKVSDSQTEKLMHEFYIELLKDFNYRRALAQAKRNLISKYHLFSNTWGAFVLIE